MLTLKLAIKAYMELLTKMYMSEIYFYQRTGLQPLKMREKLSLTLGTPIVGHPVFTRTFGNLHRGSQIFHLKIIMRYLYLFGKEVIFGLLGLISFVKGPTTEIFNIHKPLKVDQGTLVWAGHCLGDHWVKINDKQQLSVQNDFKT